MANKKLLARIALVVAVFVAFLIAYLVLAIGTSLSGKNIDTSEQIDSALPNGVLTGTAIIFAFVGFELRKLDVNPMEKFFLVLPVLGMLIWTVETYFLAAMSNGYATKGVMFLVTYDFLFTALYYSISMQLKSVYEEAVKDSPTLPEK